MNSYSSPELDSQELRSLAGQILSRDEYAGARLDAAPDWIAAIVEWLSALTHWIDGLYVISPVQFWLLFAGLIVVLLLLVVHLSYSLAVALRSGPEAVSREVSATATDYAGQAQQLAAEGRYLEGAHQLLLASLRRAAQSGVIELRPEDTNLVVRAALESSSIPRELRSELTDLIRATERAWFRNRANDPALYDRWSQAYGELVQATQ